MEGGDLRRKERRKGQGHGHLPLCPRYADGSLASLLLWGYSWVRGEPRNISCEERSILEDVMHGLSLARMPFSTTRSMGGRGRQASVREHWTRRSGPQLALCTISYQLGDFGWVIALTILSFPISKMSTTTSYALWAFVRMRRGKRSKSEVLEIWASMNEASPAGNLTRGAPRGILMG